MDLTGKVVVVTGGSGGIGEAIARIFAEHGAKVVLLARDAARAEAARKGLGRDENTLALACDVRRREDIERVVKLTLERFQRIDVWVNNAGFGIFDSVAGMDMTACRDLFDTNFFGVVHALQAVIPVMTRQGSGSIINISSLGGHIPLMNGGAYSASKFAVSAIGKAVGMELRKKNVRVLTVCPGFVDTNFTAKVVTGEHLKDAPSRAVHKISPQRVARAVLRGYRRKKREVIVPWTMIPAVKIYQLFPGFVEWLMVRGG